MYCSKCGKENVAENAFCSGCGAALNAVSEQKSVQPILDKQSFLAVSDEYKAKKKSMSRITIMMVISSVLLFIFLFGGMITLNSTMLTLGLVILIVEVIVFTPVMVVKSTRAEKFGDQLYTEYIKNNK